MIEAADLSKRYGEKPAAGGSDFDDQPGVVLGLSGEGNG